MTYKPGQFNYCDYRCERCEDANDCMLYKQERASRFKHVLKGEDPDDMKVVMQDVGENLCDAFAKIRQFAEEEGIDLMPSPEIDAEYEREKERTEYHPLYKKGCEFYERCGKFIETCNKMLVITPEIQGFFDDLKWNRNLIPPKTARALPLVDDEVENEDSRKTAELIIRILERCIESLKKIAYYRPESRESTQDLAAFAKKLIEDWKSFACPPRGA